MITALAAFDADDFRAFPTETGKLRRFGITTVFLLSFVTTVNPAFAQSIERKLFELDPQSIDFANPDVIPHDM